MMKNIILTINNNFPNKYCDFELEPSFISSIAEDHTNAISDVIGLSTGLAQKSDVGHIHSENYISFINGKTNLVNVSSPNGQISSNQNDIRISIPRIK